MAVTAVRASSFTYHAQHPEEDFHTMSTICCRYDGGTYFLAEIEIVTCALQAYSLYYITTEQNL